MVAITVRNIPEETHRALRARAKAHGRSTEAEIRAVLDEAVRPEGRLKLGSAIRAIVEPLGGFDLEITRDQTPPRFVSFE
jgi:plasmid stability protein